MAPMTREELKKIRENAKQQKNWIKVGYSSCGIAAGAREVFECLSEEVKKRNLDIEVKKCGCAGMCHAEPLVEVAVEGMPTVFYGKVDKEIAIKILEKHVAQKMLINDCIFDIHVHQKDTEIQLP
jgi:(2Fe-2S) ferredoxin